MFLSLFQLRSKEVQKVALVAVPVVGLNCGNEVVLKLWDVLLLVLIGENAPTLVLGRYCGDCGSNDVSFIPRFVLAAVLIVLAAIILSIRQDSFLENTGGFDIELVNILTG